MSQQPINDPIKRVIIEQWNTYSDKELTPLQWMTQYFTTFDAIRRQINDKHPFTEAHKSHFLTVFDPILNQEHFVWWQSDGTQQSELKRQLLLQLMHAQTKMFADTLTGISANIQEWHHEIRPNENKNDPIGATIASSSKMMDAIEKIHTLLDHGAFFSLQHAQDFVQRYSPVYNPNHELWETVLIGERLLGAKDFGVSHGAAETAADMLSRYSWAKTNQVKGIDLTKALEDYKSLDKDINESPHKQSPGQHKM